MDSADYKVPFRAGNLCTMDSKYTCSAFVRAAQIYGFMKQCGKANNPKRPLTFKDLKTPAQSFLAEKWEALDLLFGALAYEKFYAEILKTTAILPLSFYSYRNLALIILHDMKERHMLTGICKYSTDIVIMDIEEQFEKERLRIWAELSKMISKNHAKELCELREPKFSKYCDLPTRKTSFFGWVNLKKNEVKDAIEHLISRGYEVRKCLKHCGIYIDLPNVLIIETEEKTRFLRERVIFEHKLIIQDILGCVGPHALMNTLVQQMRMSAGVPFKRDRRLNMKSAENADCNLYPEVEAFDVVVAEAGNGLVIAHIALLLQSHGFKGNILVFNSGTTTEIKRCERTLRKIRISNVFFYSEKLTNLYALDPRLRNVRAAYLNPKSTFSAIINPLTFLVSEDTQFDFLLGIYHSFPDIDEIANAQLELLNFCLKLPRILAIVYAVNSVRYEETEGVIAKVLELNESVKGEYTSHTSVISVSRKSSANSFTHTEIRNHIKENMPKIPRSACQYALATIPVNAEGFEIPDKKYLKILPQNGNNGCFVTALVRDPEIITGGVMNNDAHIQHYCIDILNKMKEDPRRSESYDNHIKSENICYSNMESYVLLESQGDNEVFSAGRTLSISSITEEYPNKTMGKCRNESLRLNPKATKSPSLPLMTSRHNYVYFDMKTAYNGQFQMHYHFNYNTKRRSISTIDFNWKSDLNILLNYMITELSSDRNNNICMKRNSELPSILLKIMAMKELHPSLQTLLQSPDCLKNFLKSYLALQRNVSSAKTRLLSLLGYGDDAAQGRRRSSSFKKKWEDHHTDNEIQQQNIDFLRRGKHAESCQNGCTYGTAEFSDFKKSNNEQILDAKTVDIINKIQRNCSRIPYPINIINLDAPLEECPYSVF